MSETNTPRRRVIPLPATVIAALRAARARFEGRHARTLGGEQLDLADLVQQLAALATEWETRIKMVTGIGVSILARQNWADGNGFTLVAQVPPNAAWDRIHRSAGALAAAARLPRGAVIRVEREGTFPGWILLHVPTTQDPAAAMAETGNLFAAIADITAWLDTSNPHGEHEDAMRVLKLAEEAGKAAAAYIGMAGQNSRKRRTHTLNDLLGELADVALTALCAMQHFTQDESATRAVVAAKVQRIMARADIPRRTGAAGGSDQAWFWEPGWPAGEREATAQIAASGPPVYDDMAALLADIDTDADSDGDAGDPGESYPDDGPFGQPPRPVALAKLHALARKVRARIETDQLEFEAEDRARMLTDAEQWAQAAWHEAFANYGEAPPPLVWKGYAHRAEHGAWHLAAVAHLGDTVFLTHHRRLDPSGAEAPGHCFEVITPRRCAANRYRQDPAAWLADLADALDQIPGEHPACAGTCAASSIGDPDARPRSEAGA